MFGYCHQLYRLLGTKRLASSQGFEVRLLADCYTVFHAPKTHRFRILAGGGGGGGGGGQGLEFLGGQGGAKFPAGT